MASTLLPRSFYKHSPTPEACRGRCECLGRIRPRPSRTRPVRCPSPLRKMWSTRWSACVLQQVLVAQALLLGFAVRHPVTTVGAIAQSLTSALISAPMSSAFFSTGFLACCISYVAARLESPPIKELPFSMICFMNCSTRAVSSDLLRLGGGGADADDNDGLATRRAWCRTKECSPFRRSFKVLCAPPPPSSLARLRASRA